MIKKYVKRGLFFTLILFFIIALVLYIFRLSSSKEVDDVNPLIQCDSEILDKSDVLWVIPLFNNESIAENKSWCDYILSLNKTLELHGIYHNYKEFDVKRESNYIEKGIIEFEKCFGFKPDKFKAPQLALSGENKKILNGLGFKVYGRSNQFTHKVYHCSDTGIFSNEFIEKF